MVVIPMGALARRFVSVAAVATVALWSTATAQDVSAGGEPDSARELQAAFDAATSKVRASVVGIIVTRQAPVSNPAIEESEVGPVPAVGVEYIMGSGFVADDQGWVITSTPLVADSEHVEVLTESGVSLPVTAIHYDRMSDVAALRVDLSASPLPPVVFRSPREGAIRPGHWAIAVGPTIYRVPISSVGHVTAPYLRVLPAKQNPWASSRLLMFTSIPRMPMGEGAPVVDLDGRVLGMALPATQATSLEDAGNTMVAVTGSEVQAVFARIRSGGAVKRPWLGVHLQDVPPEAGSDLGAPDGGIYLVRVAPGGPADVAGARVGDVLVEMRPVDGERPVTLTGLADLGPILDQSHPGDRYHLTLIREGRPIEIDVVLGEFPESTGEQTLAEPQRGWGLTARAASPEELAAFGAEHGVVATKVAIGQGAFLLGIRGGDLLMQVGATPLLTLEDLEAVLDETEPDDVISIAFRRIDEQGLGSFLAVGSRQ